MKGEKINACRVFVRNPGGDRTLGRQRSRCEDNIQIDLKGVRMASTRFVWFWLQTRGVTFFKSGCEFWLFVWLVDWLVSWLVS